MHPTATLRNHKVHVYWCDWSRQWRCYSDTYGAEDSPYGEGRTLQEALDDLDWQLEEKEEKANETR